MSIMAFDILFTYFLGTISHSLLRFNNIIRALQFSYLGSLPNCRKSLFIYGAKESLFMVLLFMPLFRLIIFKMLILKKCPELAALGIWHGRRKYTRIV